MWTLIIKFYKMWVSLFLSYLIIQIKNAQTNPQLDGRIIGGIDVNVSEIPFQISLQSKERHICGGSIIHHVYVLTAAHCMSGQILRNLMVRAGSRFTEKGGVKRGIDSIILHEKYNEDNEDYDFDIAILKLHRPLLFNPAISPVALPNLDEEVKVGSPAIVSGWGFTKESGYMSTSLKKITLVVGNSTICKNGFRGIGRVTARMICASCKEGLCDSCQGDSGGPLTANGKLFGIVSWGYGCARKNYPGVYTKVSKFRKWIKNKIGY